MQDKLLISVKIKKTILYLENMVENYPKSEYVLKNNIVEKGYKLLELSYQANVHKNATYMKEIIVNIRMLEFYIKKSFDKKIISYKKLEVVGNHLLEINKMVNSWINSETSR